MRYVLNNDKNPVQAITFLEVFKTCQYLSNKLFCLPVDSKTVFVLVILFCYQGVILGS